MDFERVYASDMKKMVKWFDILTKNNIEIKQSEVVEEETTTETTAKKTSASNKPAATKTTAVKSAPPKKINSPRKMA